VSEKKEEPAIQRILVALDASTHSLAALDAAAALAASLQAELIGLFVEDENLLHLAGLPFAHEVRASSATPRRMSSDEMERVMRLQASQAKRALEAAARNVNAHWSFRVVRGQVTSSILTAALEADLLALGRVSRPLSRHTRLGSTARAATGDTGPSILLLKHGKDIHYPVLVTYDGSPLAQQALEAAAQMAHASGDDLNVLLLADTLDASRQLKQEAGQFLKKHYLSAEYHWLPQVTVNNVVRMVRAAENCVLVLGGVNPLLDAEAIQEILDRTDCPLLLVR
jgi:nucleotide-binding universal stress UspA family protein